MFKEENQFLIAANMVMLEGVLPEGVKDIFSVVYLKGKLLPCLDKFLIPLPAVLRWTAGNFVV